MDPVLVAVSLGALGGAAYLFSRSAHMVIVLGLGMLGLVSGGMAWQAARIESRLTESVQQLTGRDDVRVDCRNLLQDLASSRPGEVAYDADGNGSVAELSWSVCNDIDGWMGDGSGDPSLDEATAVHVLTHEAMHLAGYRNEQETECEAVQRDAATAVLLGADPATARLLAERYVRELYPRMPGDYRHEHCVANGPWDRTPGDGQWPGGLPLPLVPAD